jgi:V/A-type H+-transporting ATPase subunit A
MDKQLEMMRTILLLNKRSVEAVKRGVAVSDILKTGLFDKLTKIKYEISNDHLEKFAEIDKEIESVISALGQ